MICIPIALLVSIIFGQFDYSLIMLGLAVFYLTNFLYQHYEIKKLAPHLLSDNVFVTFAIAIVGFIGSSFIGYKYITPKRVVTWLIYAVVSVITIASYVILASAIFLPKEGKSAFNYVMVHFFRR